LEERVATRRHEMPYRHWFVVVNVYGMVSRTGPYVSHRAAERHAERHRDLQDAVVKVVYDPAPLGHRGRG
jgi:hypothetical protein